MKPELIVYRLMNAAQAAIIEESTNLIMEIENNAIRTQEAIRNEAEKERGTCSNADAGTDGCGG